MKARQSNFAVTLTPAPKLVSTSEPFNNGEKSKFHFMHNKSFSMLENPVVIERFYETSAEQLKYMWSKETPSVADDFRFAQEALYAPPSYRIRIYGYTVAEVINGLSSDFDSFACLRSANVVFHKAREQERVNAGTTPIWFEPVCDDDFKGKLDQIAHFAASASSATNIVERLAVMGNLISFEFGFSCGLERLRMTQQEGRKND